jgi:aminobenzoyl-glutamate utilization protein B
VGDPENGRSALDAVELMNTGVQYLREHVKTDARIHYAIIDGGGFSPNVVQPTASVLYMTRSLKVKDTLELQARVDKIAEGAAMMTETSFERVFIDGCSNTVPNFTLEALLHKNMQEVGIASYTEEEWKFAEELKSTYETYGLPTSAAKYDESAKELVKNLSLDGKKALYDFIAPLYSGDFFEAGSTDVGDVSWQTPTAQINTVCFAGGAPGHSWQNVSMGKSSIGHKGLISAGKILAASAVELFESPEILEAAKAEFKKKTEEGYTCPIPENEYAKAIKL